MTIKPKKKIKYKIAAVNPKTKCKFIFLSFFNQVERELNKALKEIELIEYSNRWNEEEDYEEEIQVQNVVTNIRHSQGFESTSNTIGHCITIIYKEYQLKRQREE